MQRKEVAIQVAPQDGVPYVTISGQIDDWHAATVDDVLTSFVQQDTDALTLDLSSASFVGVESLSGLIRSIRTVSVLMDTAIIAGDKTAELLRRADLGPDVKIAANSELDDSSVVRPREYYSSRFVPRQKDDRELPLAA